MNFLLQNLELALDERFLLVGEKLLEEGRVGALYEIERNLWVAKVEHFEAEMQITPSKVKACSCECTTFQKEKMCGHVAAGLLSLRRQLSEKQPVATPKKKARTYQRLTVGAVLESVRPEELAAFVGRYAKNNQQFSLALKTRFAASVPVADNREKYHQLLEVSLQAARKKDTTISLIGGKQLLNTIQQLLGQADDAFALNHFAEAWSVWQAVIEKIPPVLRKTSGEPDEYVEQVSTALSGLEKLLAATIAPALRQEIWQFCLAECSRPAYRYFGFAVRLFEALLGLSDDQGKVDELLEKIDNELVKKFNPPEMQVQLALTKLRLLEKAGQEKAAADYILDWVEKPGMLLDMATNAVEYGLPALAKSLAEKGLHFNKDAALALKYEAVLLGAALQDNDNKAAAHYAGNLFLKTQKLDYLRLVKVALGDEWNVFLKNIATLLAPDPDSTEILALLFAEEMLTDELLALLREEASLDLTMRFDKYLVKCCETALYVHYSELLEAYLTDHLGVVPSKKLGELFTHLYNSGASALAEKLAAFVKKKFPRRMALLDELIAERLS